MQKLAFFLKLMRPRQWTKNFVLFGGVVFTGNFFRAPLLGLAVQAFLIFCLAASAVYVLNDLVDVENDRRHPEKKHRPLAAGKIGKSAAALGGAGLMAGSLAWAAWLSPALAATVAAYLMLNMAYTLGLKHQVILDVFLVTAGFVLRAAAGALVIKAEISPWLLIVTTLLSLFLGFAKRRHELITMGEQASRHRPSLNDYSPALLDQFMGVVASCTIIAYSLYAFSSQTASAHHELMMTIPFVIYGILRYFYLVYQKNLGGAPEIILLQDRPLIIVIVCWIVAVVTILQLG